MRRARREDDRPLTGDDALRLLEKSAREGSIVAQKAVLAELRRREIAEAIRTAWPGSISPAPGSQMTPAGCRAPPVGTGRVLPPSGLVVCRLPATA